MRISTNDPKAEFNVKDTNANDLQHVSRSRSLPSRVYTGLLLESIPPLRCHLWLQISHSVASVWRIYTINIQSVASKLMMTLCMTLIHRIVINTALYTYT